MVHFLCLTVRKTYNLVEKWREGGVYHFLLLLYGNYDVIFDISFTLFSSSKYWCQFVLLLAVYIEFVTINGTTPYIAYVLCTFWLVVFLLLHMLRRLLHTSTVLC